MNVYILVDLRPTLRIIELYADREVALTHKRKLIDEDREYKQSSHEYEVWEWEIL